MSSVTVLSDDGTAKIVVGIPIPKGVGEANTLVDAGLNVHESVVSTPGNPTPRHRARAR